MEPFGERGFEQTTVAEIAARAGLTERTFSRHYADKREVLFGGSSGFSGLLMQSFADAPAGARPIDTIAATLPTAGELFAERVGHTRQRIIDAHITFDRWIEASNTDSLSDIIRESRGIEGPDGRQ